MNKEKQSHPSYGSIVVNRSYCGGPQNLYGCPTPASSMVTLEIYTSEMERELYQEWYHNRKELIEVSMSEHQWAQLLSSFAIGGGTPCTITHLNGEVIEPCPYKSPRADMNKDLKEFLNRLTDKTQKMLDRVDEIASQQTLKAADKKELKSLSASIQKDLTGAMPFMVKQFNDVMDEVVVSAKAEFEAHVSQRIAENGMAALAKEDILKIE